MDSEFKKMTDYDIFSYIEKRIQYEHEKFWFDSMTTKLMLNVIMDNVKMIDWETGWGEDDTPRDEIAKESVLRIMAICKRYIEEIYNKKPLDKEPV